MKQTIAEYLHKRSEQHRWPLHHTDLSGVDTVVVIPCLAESDTLPRTLERLAGCSYERRQSTLVICVVNNREPVLARPEDIADNRKLLQDLDGILRDRRGRLTELLDDALRLAYVDAASPANEIPKGDGVGLARKIGLDWGVRVLMDSQAPVRLLCSLDADTIVEPNYLDAVRQAFEHECAWAGVVHFEHPLPESEEHRRAIVLYECFLRSYVCGLREAGSPYAFHTVGSTMVCTPDAYVAVSGMNRKQAGEDFYFLQQLAKTGEMQSISSTTVYPSARASHRVPFGTGRSVGQSLEGVPDAVTFHAPDSYRCVRRCIDVAQRDPVDGATFLEMAKALSAGAQKFLRVNDFERNWSRWATQARSEARRMQHFHTWFDAFRTLKLIHYLRDHGHPDVDLRTASRSRESLDETDPEQILEWLRQRDRAAADTVRGLGNASQWLV